MITDEEIKKEKEFRKAMGKAKKGNFKAREKLRKMYRREMLSEQKKAAILSLFEEAASKEKGENQSDAYFFLYLCYKNGEGVKKDRIKAFKCLKEAAEKGHTQASYNLGVYYEEKGEGNPKEWFEKAAERGNKAAKQKLKEI